MERLEREGGATMFFYHLKIRRNNFWIFTKFCNSRLILAMYKNETQEIANLLGEADSESSKCATRKRYGINYQNNTDYGEESEDGTTVKFKTKVIKSNLCDYSDALTGHIWAWGINAHTKVAFKSCAPFTKCIIHINDEHSDGANNIDIIMTMYNLVEYGNNYSDTSGSLWQFKSDKWPVTVAGNPDKFSTANSTSFKYKSSFFKPLTAADNEVFKNVKLTVSLKYLSNFWRSLKMP